MGKSLLIKTLVIGSLISLVLAAAVMPTPVWAQSQDPTKTYSKFCGLDKSSYQVTKKVKMLLTAYTSSPDETDDTPFITASGKHVEDGIIANNMLPFGTKIRIPSLYGGKVFTVQDRLHPRKGFYQIDIWMTGKAKAFEFGTRVADIEILES